MRVINEDLKAAGKDLAAALKQAQTVISLKDLKSKVKEQRAEQEKMSLRMDYFFNEKGAQVPEEEIKIEENESKKRLARTKDVRRGFYDLIDTIGEGMEKSRKQVMEKLGIVID